MPLWKCATLRDETAVHWRDLALAVDFGRDANAAVLGAPFATPRPMAITAKVEALGAISSAVDASVAMKTLFSSFPRCGVYLLEEQMKRNSNTTMLEAAFSGVASTVPGALVLHVPCSRVGTEFELPHGHAERKRAAEGILMEMLNANVESACCAFGDPFRAVVSGLGRVHDVADGALLLFWYAKRGRKEFPRPTVGALITFVLRATAPQNLRAEKKRKEKKEENRKRAAERLLMKPEAKRRKKSAV